jgi:hypothetical protein
MPGGVGTRPDVALLLKDSQYVNETVTDSQINTVVSGALDRLHSESDPCVKFDPDQKLWMYLFSFLFFFFSFFFFYWITIVSHFYRIGRGH